MIKSWEIKIVGLKRVVGKVQNICFLTLNGIYFVIFAGKSMCNIHQNQQTYGFYVTPNSLSAVLSFFERERKD